MKKLSFPIILMLVFQFASAQEGRSLESRIDAYIQPYLEMEAWSGVLSIYKGGEPVFQKAYGYADREWEIPNTAQTKFRIASISKLFTEVAILTLVEGNKLSLDEKLSSFIPDYPRGDEISVEQLLTHRSGIPHLNRFPNYNELIKYEYEIGEIIDLFKNKPLDFEPGERYSYSNSGYVLLAYIIEQRSGISYESYLNKEIIAKVGLDNTGVDDEKKILEKRARGYMFNELGDLIHAEHISMDIKIGGGSLYSTAHDLHAFTRQLLKGNILTSTLDELPNFGEIDGESVFTANGRVQGFCHQITHIISQDLTIMVLGNHYSNIALPIADDLYKIYTNQPYQKPENYLSQKIEVPTAELLQYEGTYDFGFGPIGKVKVVDGYLGYGAPGRNTYDKLIPIGGDRFFYLQSWVLLEFSDEEEGRYNTLGWIMGTNEYPANRVKN
ncbi:MAG: serine hydrolase domain-containing protein [Bacteroidota bacterium]